MKKLILLGLATLITFSASAQIEMYTETKENPTLTQEQVDEMILLSKLENRDPYFWGNLKSTALRSSETTDKNVLGDTLYSLPSIKGNFYCLSTNKSEDTLKIVKFPYGEYFYVKNILYGSSLKKMFAKFDEMVYVCDRIEDSSFKKGYFEIPKITRDNPNNSKKKPIWQWLFTSYDSFRGHSDKVVYVLENKGVTYYITKERSSLCPKNQYQPISTPELADFISVKSYNMFKEKYVGEEVYMCNIWSRKRHEFREELKLHQVEKILVKDGKLYGEFRSLATDVVRLSLLDQFYELSLSANGYINEVHDTICCIGDFCLKSDADSLLAKWAYEEEQIALAKKQQQTQHKEELIKKYGKQYGSLIADGKICVGMTKEMCIAAKGSPCRKSTHTDRYDTTEVWTYHCNSSFYYPIYVTFSNNKITSIADL